MKKIIIKSLFTALVFFSFYTLAFADTKTGYVNATAGLRLRKNAGTTYSIVGLLNNNTSVTILDTRSTADSSNSCPSKIWYYVTSGSKKGYACSDYIVITSKENTSSSEIAKMTDKEFDTYLTKQGFPNDYKEKLKALHKLHPNWVFKAVKSKYSWANALDQENVNGRSLYQVTATGVKNGLQGYLNTGSDFYDYSTDKFKAKDGTSWFQANNQTIAYYMDPRNFLTETGIFMFEDLTYYESYQNEKLIKKILYTDFYKDYIKHYISGAKKYNVSPVYLAALSRQEVGLNSSTATSGKAGTYNNVNYDGYYNFYNIGASSGTNPVYNGLAYSKNAGWTSPEIAIVEGAGWIVKGYISRGQYTRYFQKWNTSPTSTTGMWHQYMTDIKAIISPSALTFSSYSVIGITNEALVFTIPVYDGMPSKTTLPATGNPNNWLKSLLVNKKNIKNFSGNTTSYDLGTVENQISSIKIEVTPVNEKANITGDGNINLKVGKNKIDIIVVAENGAKRTYSLSITRKESEKIEEETPEEISISKILNNLSIKNNNNNIYGFTLGTTTDTLTKNIINQNSNGVVKIANSSNQAKGSSSKLSTGDKITITSNKETKTYQIVIYGDINGDGAIDAKDLLIIRKYLLKERTLSGVYLEAAKLNRSSKVDAKDLLILRKYLLGTMKISQV